MMQPFHRRMAELWCKAMRTGHISTRDKVEWIESLHAHMLWVSKINRLENWMYCAELIGDQEEQTAIRSEIDKLMDIRRGQQ